jgi:hypothetical protein
MTGEFESRRARMVRPLVNQRGPRIAVYVGLKCLGVFREGTERCRAVLGRLAVSYRIEHLQPLPIARCIPGMVGLHWNVSRGSPRNAGFRRFVMP